MNIQQYTTLVTFQSNVSFCQARQNLYIMQQYADAVTTKPLELRHQQQFLLVYCNKATEHLSWPCRLAGMCPMTSMSLTSVCVWMSSTPT